MTGDSLTHWGIKGQKRGVKRYQNEDGTWTEEGKRRRRIREGPTTSKNSSTGDNPIKKKKKFKPSKASLMSDDELREAIARMRLEDDYKKVYKSLHPEKESLFKKSGERALTELIEKSADSLINITLEALFGDDAATTGKKKDKKNSSSSSS